MFFTKTTLEEVTGFKHTDLELDWFDNNVKVKEVLKEDLMILFERVREKAYEQGRNNAQESALYQQCGEY